MARVFGSRPIVTAPGVLFSRPVGTPLKHFGAFSLKNHAGAVARCEHQGSRVLGGHCREKLKLLLKLRCAKLKAPLCGSMGGLTTARPEDRRIWPSRLHERAVVILHYERNLKRDIVTCRYLARLLRANV